MSAFGFADKTAVVTGASSGIGRCIAIELGSRGATVCLVGRNRGRLQAVEERIRAVHSRVEHQCCDLQHPEEITRLCDHIRSRYSAVDVLVHSAGVISTGTLERSDPSSFDLLFAVNVRAPYLLTRELLPLLKQCSGQIVFLNSTAGLRCWAGLGLYAASKHALRALADALRQELGDAGVRVLSVYPGKTATAMQDALREGQGRSLDTTVQIRPDDLARTIVETMESSGRAQVTDLKILPWQDLAKA